MKAIAINKRRGNLKNLSVERPNAPNKTVVMHKLKPKTNDMKLLIKKYSILLISAIVISHLLAGIILTIWPNFLTTELPEGGTST